MQCRALVCLTFASIALVTAAPARAWESHLEIQVFAQTAPVFADRSLHVQGDDDAIDMLSHDDIRVSGNGALSGGGLRAVVHLGRVRLGYEEAVFVANGLNVRTGSVPDGFSVTTGSVWGGRFELSIGRDLVSEDTPKDGIVPYVDLRCGLGLLTTKLVLHSTQWGTLGNESLLLLAPYIGPRAGVRVPLGSATFMDFSGSWNVIGLERATFTAGLGLTDF